MVKEETKKYELDYIKFILELSTQEQVGYIQLQKELKILGGC